MSKTAMLSDDVLLKIHHWELAFNTVHGRMPAKNDSDLAPGHLRKSFVQYSTKGQPKTGSTHGVKRCTSFRLKRDKFDFSIKGRVSQEACAGSVPKMDNFSPKNSTFSNSEKCAKSSHFDNSHVERRLLDEIVADDKKRYYAVEPLSKLRPKINKSSLLEPDWLDESSSSRDRLLSPGVHNIPADVDLSKRRKMCNFVVGLTVGNLFANSEPDQAELLSNLSGEENDENQCDTNIDEEFKSSAKLFLRQNNGRKKAKSNDNFTKINLKQKRFAPISSTVKKLKGAALKRLLYKIKNAKLRRR